MGYSDAELRLMASSLRGAYDGVARAFEARPDKTFTGAQIAEVMRAAAEEDGLVEQLREAIEAQADG